VGGATSSTRQGAFAARANQRALYIKRLLLVEPGVILASVPYQLL